MSESEIQLKLVFENDFTLPILIDRVLAPLIVEEIKSRLPIEGRAAFMRGEMKIILDINKGNLKPTYQVKYGDVAYMPLGDSLCIYAKDMKTFSPVNIIGHVVSQENLHERLQGLKRGSRVTISPSK